MFIKLPALIKDMSTPTVKKKKKGGPTACALSLFVCLHLFGHTFPSFVITTICLFAHIFAYLLIFIIPKNCSFYCKDCKQCGCSDSFPSIVILLLFCCTFCWPTPLFRFIAYVTIQLFESCILCLEQVKQSVYFLRIWLQNEFTSRRLCRHTGVRFPSILWLVVASLGDRRNWREH